MPCTLKTYPEWYYRSKPIIHSVLERSNVLFESEKRLLSFLLCQRNDERRSQVRTRGMNIGNWVQCCRVARWQRHGNLGVSFMYVGRSKSSHRVGQTCFGHDWHLWQFPMLYTKGWMFNTIRFYKPSSVHSYAFFSFSLRISGHHLAIYRPHSTLTFFIIFVFCLTIKLHLLPVILIK